MTAISLIIDLFFDSFYELSITYRGPTPHSRLSITVEIDVRPVLSNKWSGWSSKPMRERLHHIFVLLVSTSWHMPPYLRLQQNKPDGCFLSEQHERDTQVDRHVFDAAQKLHWLLVPILRVPSSRENQPITSITWDSGPRTCKFLLWPQILLLQLR